MTLSTLSEFNFSSYFFAINPIPKLFSAIFIIFEKKSTKLNFFVVQTLTTICLVLKIIGSRTLT